MGNGLVIGIIGYYIPYGINAGEAANLLWYQHIVFYTIYIIYKPANNQTSLRHNVTWLENKYIKFLTIYDRCKFDWSKNIGPIKTTMQIICELQNRTLLTRYAQPGSDLSRSILWCT